MKKMFFRIFLPGLCALLGLFGMGGTAFGQNMITLPSQSTTYSGYVRGFWFIAPTGFTITGLRVPASAGSGTQSIQVMKIHAGGVAVYSATGTNFTTLYYTNSGANNVIQNVSIPVEAGDTIGILGQAGTTTSYGPSSPSPYPSDIAGIPMDLHRFLYQGDITSAPAPNYSSENTSSIGRIEVYYQIAPPNNAGVDSLVAPDVSGDFCSGMQMVKVRMGNFGSNPLSSVQVNWSVDGSVQPAQFLTFSPPVDSVSSPNHDTIIELGYANFPYQSAVHLKVWTSLPNGVPDTDPSDDTLNAVVKAGKEAVVSHVSPHDTTICTGRPIILDAGQQPAGSVFIWSNGAITQQTAVSQAGHYSVIIQSLQGCFAYDTVNVGVYPVLIGGTFGVVHNDGRRFTFTPAGEQNVTNYFWDFGDGHTLSTGVAIQHHQYDQDGTFAVTLKEGNPCDTFTIARQVYVSTTPNSIGQESDQAATVKIYPNPVRGKATISAMKVPMEKIVVYNTLGQKVYEVVPHNPYRHELDVSGMASGVYNVSVYTAKGLVIRKLSVIK